MNRAFTDRIARRAEAILHDSDDAQAEMAWAERKLADAGLLGGGRPDRNDVAAWTREAIADNQDIQGESVPWLLGRGWKPEAAETFEELLLTLIVSEGGL